MKKIVYGLIISIALLSLTTLTSCKTTETVEPETEITQEEQSTKEPELSEKADNYNFVEINEEFDYLTTKISYPQFDNCTELNEEIKRIIEYGWINFKSYAEKSWNEINALNADTSSSYPPYEYYVESKVSFSGDIISVYVSTYRFAGGAHGETFITTFNYDVNKCQKADITEISGYSYDELSDMCRKSLYNKLISEKKFEITGEEVTTLTEMIDFGTLPMEGNFQKFTVNGDTLTVYFEQYSVAPYAYGIQKVELPL